MSEKLQKEAEKNKLARTAENKRFLFFKICMPNIFLCIFRICKKTGESFKDFLV